MAELTTQNRALIQGHTSDEYARPRRQLSPWVWIFIIGLVIPLFIHLGPLRLSVYRLVLIAAFFPALFYWLSGRAGPIRLPDICVLVICLWSTLSLAVIHGFAMMFETIGILWIETLGAYLLGRCYIRTPEAFHAMTRLLFRIGLLLLPFALYELYAGPSPVIDLFEKIGPSYNENKNAGRIGLERVQGPFDHPIHFGLFFGAMVGIFYYVLGYRRSLLNRVRNAGMAVFLCFCSLSSGPLAAAMAQIIFLLWDGIMKSVRNRWYIFIGLALFVFILLDILSNRSPFHVFISYFAFSEHTAYNRIHIWEFGTASIWANPLFGIGMTDNWARPWWMSSSVDMFWILPAMRHGVVVWIAYLALFFSTFLSVIYHPALSERVQWYRMGYLCTMSGLFVVGWTVHFWDGPFVFLMFLLASGIWILDWEDRENDAPTAEAAPQSSRYTRFPRKPSAFATRAPTDATRMINRAGGSVEGDLRQSVPMSSRSLAGPQEKP